MRPELEPLPERMRDLPIDNRGYVVPWFVSWIDGQPEFRCIEAGKVAVAINRRSCWVCGGRLGAWYSFTTGPMCTVNMVNSEPPSHLECATWSAKNCPFLSRPHMVRRDDNMPEGHTLPGGCPIMRNPGAVAVLTTRSYSVWRDREGKPMIDMGPVEHLEWYAMGRPARRAEVEESLRTGMPLLMEMAVKDGEMAVAALLKMRAALERWLPVD